MVPSFPPPTHRTRPRTTRVPVDISPHAMGCCRERIRPSTRPRYLSGHKPGCHGIRGVPPTNRQPAAIFLPMCRAAVTCIERVRAENRQGEQVATRRGVWFHCCSIHAGSRQSGVCQDGGALCLRFRNHPGLMSMTETTHKLRDKRKAASFCSAWGLGIKGWPSAVQEVAGNLDASRSVPLCPGTMAC